MTKTEIIGKVAETTGLTKKQSESAVNATLKAIQDGLASDGKVQFVGFGSFKSQTRPARIGRNPATGLLINIPEKTVTKFTASK